MGKKKPIVSSLGQWAYPGEVTIIPSNSITMKGVGYPVLGVDNLGNSQMMMPGADYTFPGDYVTEIPQMGKGGLTQWFAEEWTDVKTGKPCGRSGKEKGSRPYPACRPKKRVNETTPKTTSEMSSAEKARFKREKTSGKRIDYNHKRRQLGGQEDSTIENIAEFFDPTGYTSWDDANRAYNEWKKSNSVLPSMSQALDMFGAVPALGKFGKLKYLDPNSIKTAYKAIPWQQILNAFDTAEDEISKTKKKYGGWLEQYQEGGEEPAPEDIEKMETIEINSRVGNKQVSKRKTDLDREINTGYNIFDKLKNKANRFILNLVASNPAFAQTLIEGTKIADKAVRKVGDKTKDFIYENYRPVEYPTVFGAIHNLYKGSAPPIVNPEGKLIPGEEAYRLALGLPTEQNYIIPSKYRPSTSTDPSMSYYTMPDVFNQQALIDAYMEQSKGQPGQKVQIKALSPFIKNENKIDSPDIPFEQTDPLQNFQLSQGSDERGNYISLYDIYDFGAPFDQLIYGSNRKPIEFYDRFYYTTNAQGKPVYKKKYGGWLNKYK